MNIKYYSAFFAFIFLNSTVVAAVELETEQQKLSYALGASVAINVAQQDAELDLDVAVFIQAVTDILEGNEPQISIEEMEQVMSRYKEKITEELANTIEKNKVAGESFLAKNKQEEGIMTSATGLQYKVITAGSGKQPSVDSSVTVHYKGSLIDGTVFDSSYDRGDPATLTLSQVIQGWQEALPMMKEGGKWQIYVPAELGYGDRGAGQIIAPGSVLIFDIELISIN